MTGSGVTSKAKLATAKRRVSALSVTIHVRIVFTNPVKSALVRGEDVWMDDRNCPMSDTVVHAARRDSRIFKQPFAWCMCGSGRVVSTLRVV